LRETIDRYLNGFVAREVIGDLSDLEDSAPGVLLLTDRGLNNDMATESPADSPIHTTKATMFSVLLNSPAFSAISLRRSEQNESRLNVFPVCVGKAF
jgi:hypothetical protein